MDEKLIALAQEVSDTGCRGYRDKGAIPPFMALLNEDWMGMGCAPSNEMHTTDAFHGVLYVTRYFLMPRYIVMCSEAWAKHYEPGEPDTPEQMERGYLESISDTDPTVKTAIITWAFDTKTWHHLYISARDDGPDTWTYDRFATDDPGDVEVGGHAAEGLKKAWDEAPVPPDDMPRPESLEDLHGFAKAMETMGVCQAAAPMIIQFAADGTVKL